MSDHKQSLFMKKVSVNSKGCWIWTGYVNKTGYGCFHGHGNKTIRAHKFGYEMKNGPVPMGLQLDHLCRVKKCVNPDHLEAVTAKINSNRAPVIGFKINEMKTECPKGHIYNKENTYIGANGWRKCRTCRREGMRTG
jgi:hypothetical protein